MHNKVKLSTLLESESGSITLSLTSILPLAGYSTSFPQVVNWRQQELLANQLRERWWHQNGRTRYALSQNVRVIKSLMLLQEDSVCNGKGQKPLLVLPLLAMVVGKVKEIFQNDPLLLRQSQLFSPCLAAVLEAAPAEEAPQTSSHLSASGSKRLSHFVTNFRNFKSFMVLFSLDEVDFLFKKKHVLRGF